MRLCLLMVFAFLFTVTTAFAFPQTKPGVDCASCHTLSVKEANDLIGKLIPGGKVVEVKQSPVKGLFELHLESNGRVGIAHVDYSKKYIVSGLIYDIASGATTTPITPPKPEKVDLSRIPLTDSVVMGNPKGTKKLIVFTDPECPFCKRLHSELKKLVAMDPDVVVYVKMFPLRMHPQAYDVARAILTSKDPVGALDKVFEKSEQLKPEGDAGKDAVNQSIKLGESLGVTSTPTLVFSDGTLQPGASDAASILQKLNGVSR